MTSAIMFTDLSARMLTIMLFILAVEGNASLQEEVESLSSNTVSRSTLAFKYFNSESLGGEKILQLYLNCLDTDDQVHIKFLPPEGKDGELTKASIKRALVLMERIDPELVNEFKNIVIEVVLASSAKGLGEFKFDGASSYMLWGALVLNVDDSKSDLEMMETLVHESAHSFLFGMTIDEPLVFNDDNELYQSPFRVDSRPMDGIYHATFVASRMHYALQQAKKSKILDDEQMLECKSFLQASKKAFFDGYGVVREHGNLSSVGKALMQDALKYMEEIAPLQ